MDDEKCESCGDTGLVEVTTENGEEVQSCDNCNYVIYAPI